MLSPFLTKSDLIVHSQTPFNAEPPLHRLRGGLMTGQNDFYVRSHGNIPRLDEKTHRLRVAGMVQTPLDLSVPDLRDRFPARTVTAVMQCAGNRRADQQQVRPTSGDPWAPGAIGNADWTGISLADVLSAAGADDGCHAACRLRRLRRGRDAGGGALQLRRLDPHGQGHGTGSPARLRDERRDLGAGARVSAAGRGARLRRRAQPEMAVRHHGAGQAIGQPHAGRATTSWCQPT